MQVKKSLLINDIIETKNGNRYLVPVATEEMSCALCPEYNEKYRTWLIPNSINVQMLMSYTTHLEIKSEKYTFIVCFQKKMLIR